VGYWGRTLIIVPIIASIATTLLATLRVYSRRSTHRKMDVDDIFIGLGLLFYYGLTISTVKAGYNSVGYDTLSLFPSTRQRITFLFWLSQKMWPLSQIFVKLSIIVVLRRLLGSVPHWHNTTTALIGFTVAWGVTAMIEDIFQCWPLEYFWLKDMHQQDAFYVIIGSLSLLENFVLVLMPIMAVWKLKLTGREKMQLTFLFGVGGLVCAVGILRLITSKDHAAMDLTSSGCLEAVWSIIELDLGIFCASLILMRPLYHRCAEFCKICCWRSRKLAPSSTGSSDRVKMVKSWPWLHTIHGCSQVHAEAYSTNACIADKDCSFGLGDIQVEVCIDREVQDRAAVLTVAESGSETWSVARSSRQMSMGFDGRKSVDLQG
ncbi:hypothetical protein BO71DRAFT_317339, partial [Aspergillus ellipticus CBS 707.79]